MKASELRIGNLVKWNGNDYEVSLNTFYTEVSSNSMLEELSPIPLTEEWLVKLGFEFDVFYQKHSNGIICIYWLDKVCLVSWCKYHRQDLLRYKYPEYVHELQNLYFALKGEELTIKQD